MEKQEFDEKSPAIKDNMMDLLSELNKGFIRSEADKEALRMQMVVSAILQVDLVINSLEPKTPYDIYAGLIEIFNINAEEFTKQTLKKRKRKTLV